MYDLVIIGAGWAGFNAALRAQQAGWKVCLIEKDQIGGTCLNRGCIPTKALIQSARAFSLAKKSAEFGIQASSLKADFGVMQSRKNSLITHLRSGMQFLLKGIEIINAEAKFISSSVIKAGGRTVEAKFILIATGSRPMRLAQMPFDGKKVVSSDEILELREVPESLLVIGGGVIGCEFASLFACIGSRVTLVEKMPQLLPGEDSQVARKLEAFFRKRGIIVQVGTDAQAVNRDDYSLVLVAVGREPFISGLEVEKIGLKIEKNVVTGDEYLRTNIGHIFAAGDCTGGIMLAHFAAYQGRSAVENMLSADNQKPLDTRAVPNCIFTDPEIARVGLTQEQACSRGIKFKPYHFDFLGSGMARILGETEGFIKILADAQSDEIIGAAIIGPRATELIAVCTLAVSRRLKVKEVGETIFAHPTLSEAVADTLRPDGRS